MRRTLPIMFIIAADFWYFVFLQDFEKTGLGTGAVTITSWTGRVNYMIAKCRLISFNLWINLADSAMLQPYFRDQFIGMNWLR
jgi:hypothetical protein